MLRVPPQFFRGSASLHRQPIAFFRIPRKRQTGARVTPTHLPPNRVNFVPFRVDYVSFRVNNVPFWGQLCSVLVSMCSVSIQLRSFLGHLRSVACQLYIACFRTCCYRCFRLFRFAWCSRTPSRAPHTDTRVSHRVRRDTWGREEGVTTGMEQRLMVRGGGVTLARLGRTRLVARLKLIRC